MAQLNLKGLIGKLNETCRRSLEAAAGLCLSRTNYNVEIEHWLLKLLESARHRSGGHPPAIRRRFVPADRGPDPRGRPAQDGQRAAAGVEPERGRSGARGLADLLGGLRGTPACGPGICWPPCFGRRVVSRSAAEASREFDKISVEALRKALPALVAQTAEAGSGGCCGDPGRAAQPGRPAGPTKTPALDQYTIDLTAPAKQGQLDPGPGPR